MDNLSDYVPLIIIIGSIIYSVIKGKAKNVQEETAKTTLPGRTSREAVLTGEDIPSKSSVKKQKAAKRNSVSPVKKEQKETFGKMNTRVIPNGEMHLPEESEYVKPLLDIENNEEIKRAFIYSEILNRKDY